jgi:hypothetical protein
MTTARRRHAGNTAEQHAGAALLLLQAMRADLHRHAAGHLAHRRQQRQPAAMAGDRLVGDGGDTGLHQPLRLLGIGREMQIGEEDLPFFQLSPFLWLRLFHLHHHFGLAEDLLGIARDLRAGGFIGLVVEADAHSGAGLDQHLMAIMDEFAHAARHQSDPVLVRFDFLRYSNQHRFYSANTTNESAPPSLSHGGADCDRSAGLIRPEKP